MTQDEDFKTVVNDDGSTEVLFGRPIKPGEIARAIKERSLARHPRREGEVDPNPITDVIVEWHCSNGDIAIFESLDEDGTTSIILYVENGDRLYAIKLECTGDELEWQSNLYLMFQAIRYTAEASLAQMFVGKPFTFYSKRGKLEVQYVLEPTA